MTNNGTPVTYKRTDGTTDHGVLPLPSAPVRTSAFGAQPVSPQPPAEPTSDGNTASFPALTPVPQPPAEPTPAVDPQQAPGPTTPPDENKEHTMSKQKLTFQHFVPHLGALLGIGVLAVLVGILKIPMLGAVPMLMIAPALVMLITFVRRAKVTLTDKVKGNSLVPLVAVSIISATLTAIISALLNDSSGLGSALRSDFFWGSFIVIGFAIALFLLQGANLDKTDSNPNPNKEG